MKKQNFGLGRGLSSLIPRKDQNLEKEAKIQQENSSVNFEIPMPKIAEVEIGKISSNRHQPRKQFDEQSLRELAESIKKYGIIQPLVVVPSEDGTYELIAGERRLRAAKIAGFSKVPIIKREANELERLEIALIENIQRADLNPIEEAEAYQKLNDEFGLTHGEIGKRVGKTRPLISNAIRLLGLPPEIQMAVAEKMITTGHARLILEIQDNQKRIETFKKILENKMNISDTSREVRRVEVNRHTRRVTKDPVIEEYERLLRDKIGTKVSIGRKGKESGIITIEFYGEDELRNIMSILTEN